MSYRFITYDFCTIRMILCNYVKSKGTKAKKPFSNVLVPMICLILCCGNCPIALADSSKGLKATIAIERKARDQALKAARKSDLKTIVPGLKSASALIKQRRSVDKFHSRYHNNLNKVFKESEPDKKLSHIQKGYIDIQKREKKLDNIIANTKDLAME